MPIKERPAVFGVSLPILEGNMGKRTLEKVTYEVDTFDGAHPWRTLEGSVEVFGEDTIRLYSPSTGEHGEIHTGEEINDLKLKKPGIFGRRIIWRR